MHPLIFKKPRACLGVFCFRDLNFNSKIFNMKKTTNIHIGHCTSPHGIKGELSFVLYSPEDSALDKGMVITLTPRSPSSSVPQDGKEFKIKTIC